MIVMLFLWHHIMYMNSYRVDDLKIEKAIKSHNTPELELVLYVLVDLNMSLGLAAFQRAYHVLSVDFHVIFQLEDSLVFVAPKFILVEAVNLQLVLEFSIRRGD